MIHLPDYEDTPANAAQWLKQAADGWKIEALVNHIAAGMPVKQEDLPMYLRNQASMGDVLMCQWPPV